MDGPRSPQQRKRDTLTALSRPGADVWVSSAHRSGDLVLPYLVPLSLCWTGERVVVAVAPFSRTARNLAKTRSARLATGGTRDLVMIDASLDAEFLSSAVSKTVAEDYRTQVGGWDPRDEDSEFTYLLLKPIRVQAWREADEIEGRTIMTDGVWLV